MSVALGAFPRKTEYYCIKIEAFDGIGMIGSEKFKVKDLETIKKIKEFLRTEIQNHQR
jgi:hypothetical protein